MLNPKENNTDMKAHYVMPSVEVSDTMLTMALCNVSAEPAENPSHNFSPTPSIPGQKAE